MTSHVPIHARNHRPGGVDPLTFPFPRARVWATYAIPPYTITDSVGGGSPLKMNHGYTTDESVFWIRAAGGNPHFVRVRIKQGGVYAVLLRISPDAYLSGASWDGTQIGYELYDIAPDLWDGFHDRAWCDGFAVVRSYVTIIQNDPDWVPIDVYCRVYVPAEFPALTFGDATEVGEDPSSSTGSMIEVIRLGAAKDTADWLDWWDETPSGEALPAATDPAAASGLLAPTQLSAIEEPRKRGRRPR